MVAEAEANYAQVRRILQSKAFRTSEVHRNLLNYLAEKSLSGTADSLKEYTVGLDVFAKPDSYDPRQESVVRMHTARLRQKLADMAKDAGLTLDEVFGKGRKGKGSVAPKYRDPKNPENTWTGRGRMPLWMVAATKGNKAKKDDFLI
jgi:DNA-binding protein H-NS